ncbi:FAD-dependent oxidoreductase [Nocardia flavorosea]|uniref:NAD(P)/FAD-dependent oxidoreductase n=1 Tax=Nocardia flavorosea TaxID=53429 RepID=UPI0018931FE0|nr:FAD-dependent oxidoreductase [Nocardia flavorosea]MBF6347524.1 FAD-dependent oxidoreductase [Nocardia flavorosea]
MTETETVPGAAPSPRSVVVVGASHAAVHFADRLRDTGYDGAITLISHEPRLPYQRPPLSKGWLKGETTSESLLLRDPAHYAGNEIELLTGARVERVARTPAGVRIEFADVGGLQRREFDRLVLATGARARALDLPGSAHPDVVCLRDLDHASVLADRIRNGPIVVIGGGFVGLEVAATARTLGAEVTVIEAGTRLLGRAVGETTAAALLAAHRAMGTDIVLGAQPAAIVAADEELCGVRLTDGRVIPAATVLVGIGAEPRIELATQLGLHCAGGVVVDDRCLASDGWTLAIGDCTTRVSPTTGRHYRLESVDNATTQAEVAAAVLAGSTAAASAAPWFWSDQGDQKLQIVGLTGDHCTVVVRTDPDKPRRRVALYFTGDTLVAAECLNAPADFVALRAALGRGDRPGPNMLSDSSIPLKKLLTPVRG